MVNRHIIDRALPERTKLMFYFPNPIEGEDYFIVELPFFENVEIRERKKARYQKYSLIGRSSNLYSYLGADSRSLDLTFQITLPHLTEEHTNINRMDYTFMQKSPQDERLRFKSPVATPDLLTNPSVEIAYRYLNNPDVEASAKQVLTQSRYLNYAERQYIVETYLGKQDGKYHTEGLEKAQEGWAEQQMKQDTVLLDPEAGDMAKFDRLWDIGVDSHAQLSRYKFIDLIIYWINIVRSSVVNNSENPLYGPPIIRLRHGVMFQDIPCVCLDYGIEWDEKFGFDVKTLLPRRLEIRMRLEELRTGDFQKFQPNTAILKDNLAGWESVVGKTNTASTGSMDPGYGGG